MTENQPEKVTPQEINWGEPRKMAEELQSTYTRNSSAYKQAILGLRDKLNKLHHGSLASIDVEDIKNQVSHLFYFHLTGMRDPIPFDLAYLHELVSHLKNPVVLTLRRESPCLMPSHRKIISKLTEEQARERELKLTGLNINEAIKRARSEMQFGLAESKVAGSVTRKLDYLATAMRVPVILRFDLKLLLGIVQDNTHLRQKKALLWLKESMYRGNTKLFSFALSQGLQALEKECLSIIAEMEEVSGVPFKREVEELDPNFTWHSLSTSLHRGEDFVKSFHHGERIDQRIKVLTFPIVRSLWDSENYRNRMFENQPTKKMGFQESCSKLSSIYFEVVKCIEESTKLDGEVETAINSDLRLGKLNEEDAEQARGWVRENKARLLDVKFEILEMLAKALKNNPKLVLPEKLEEELEAYLVKKVPQENLSPTSRVWTKAISNLEFRLQQLQSRLGEPDAKLVQELSQIRQMIINKKRFLTNVDLQGSVRQSCSTFKEFEEKLLEFNKTEEAFDRIRLECERNMVACYRAAHFGVDFNPDEEDYIEPNLRYSIDWLKREDFKEVFKVVLDDILLNMKELNYEIIAAERYRGYFEKAMQQDDQECLFLLERLLHEIHCLPRQDQMLHAVNCCEKMLDEDTFQKKQTFIIENDFKLQELLNEVQCELRERITKVRIRPRRLRFEVFSIADCYAENLRELLDGLMRMAPTIASDGEGERLADSITAIESQIIEAQDVTKQKGEAFQKLAQLAQQHLFPKDLVARLRKDLLVNFEDLDLLLKESNEGLKRVKQIQNKFGGQHQMDHLNHVINIYDLEKLKDTYNFLDNITMVDLKRFAMIYRHKDALLDELFENTHWKGENKNLHPAIARQVTPETLKRYRENKTIPIPLKTALLVHDRRMLEAEIHLLIYTLNYVQTEHVTKKTVYVSLLGVLNQARETPEEAQELARIWSRFRSKIENFQPQNYKMNYEDNRDKLIAKADAIIER